MLVCYLCGTKHGLSSLLFHQKQCAVKREKTQATLLPHERTAAPEPPVVTLPGRNGTQREVEKYNEDAQEMYESSMPSCSSCGRTFASLESLAKHAKACKEGDKDKSATSGDGGVASGVAKKGSSSSGPRMLVCYLCGTQHGLSSLAIHQRSCELSRQMAQKNLEPTARMAAPAAPGLGVPGLGADMEEIKAYNVEAQAIYNGSMATCGDCGRTFSTAHKLLLHAKSCGSKGEGKAHSPKAPSPPARTGPRMLVCYLCGTQHGLSSLAIHQKQCAIKRQKAQAVLAPADQAVVPPAPAMAVPLGPRVTSAEVETYNAAAQAAYNGSMPECGKCGRTFATAEKLATHAKSCNNAALKRGKSDLSQFLDEAEGLLEGEDEQDAAIQEEERLDDLLEEAEAALD
jgi:hypothetical protein